MPEWLHIALVCAITAIFLFNFIKRKQKHALIFVIWAPSTLLQYVISDESILRVIGFAQIALFIFAVFFMFKRQKEGRRRTVEILASYASGDLDKAVGLPLEKRAKAMEESAIKEIEKKTDS